MHHDISPLFVHQDIKTFCSISNTEARISNFGTGRLSKLNSSNHWQAHMGLLCASRFSFYLLAYESQEKEREKERKPHSKI
jgi:hypothetical protein